jgi:cysteine desulfurase/selenocysteine lyase
VTTSSFTPAGVPATLQPPIDTALLASLATALFAAAPGEQPRFVGPAGALPSTPPGSLPGAGQGTPWPPGVQAPVNIAPAGSPLVSPAGFGPGVPGTPIPQGLVPGANLVPASPTPLASLAHRAPALLPHAVAGNGVPDSVISTLPAYEPRFGSDVLGVPGAAQPTSQPVSVAPAQAAPAVAQGASPYYFLGDRHGHPLAADRAPRLTPPDGHGAAPGGLDALARLPFAAPEVPRVGSPTAGTGVPSTVPSTEPRFYFADAVVLPGGYTTPGRAPAASSNVPHADRCAHPAFDVHAVRRDFPVLQERVNGRQLVWFDNAATTHKPQSVTSTARRTSWLRARRTHTKAHASACSASSTRPT